MLPATAALRLSVALACSIAYRAVPAREKAGDAVPLVPDREDGVRRQAAPASGSPSRVGGDDRPAGRGGRGQDLVGARPPATGSRKSEPIAARTTLGANGSTPPRPNSTPAAPNASAERTSVPALPGSLIAHSSSTGPGRASSGPRPPAGTAATASSPGGDSRSERRTNVRSGTAYDRRSRHAPARPPGPSRRPMPPRCRTAPRSRSRCVGPRRAGSGLRA